MKKILLLLIAFLKQNSCLESKFIKKTEKFDDKNCKSDPY